MSNSLATPWTVSPPGSSVHGISQARILEWVAIFFSRGSSWPRDWTLVSCLEGEFFYHWAIREALTSLTLLEIKKYWGFNKEKEKKNANANYIETDENQNQWCILQKIYTFKSFYYLKKSEIKWTDIQLKKLKRE